VDAVVLADDGADEGPGVATSDSAAREQLAQIGWHFEKN
jgi:hypothetical protein